MNYPTVHRAMIRSIINYVFSTVNAAITASIAAFNTAMTTEQGKLANIDALYASKATIITGIAAQKKLAREVLAQTSFSIMSAVRAYAIDNGDLTTANAMKVTLSGLTRMPYQALVDRITNAISVVSPLVPDLTAYNITGSDITDWTTDLTALSDLLTGPRSAIAVRKVINDQIQNALFDAVDYLKTNGDTTVTLYMESNPAFYAGYVANRKLIHTATVPVTPALRIYVKNIEGMDITQGDIFIVGTTKSAALDTNGHAFITLIPAGPQTVSVTTPFGNETLESVDFVEGHITKLNLQIGPLSDSKPAVKITKELVAETTPSNN